MPLLQEQTLINALKAGKSTAFKQVIAQYQDHIVNTCFGFVNNSEDAEDLAQEVFIEVYRSIDNFRGGSKLSTWLYRIAVTKSLDFLRKKKAQKRIQFVKSFFGMDDEELQIADHKVVHPHLRLEQQERLNTLHKAIDLLADNQRIAFTLNKFEDLSYKEIADVMDVSLASVESLIHRAKKNLKKRLRTYYYQSL